MESLQREVQYLSQALCCSAILENVSSHLRICHLAVPWCGRQLHWQVLLPSLAHSAPDLLFDDDAFRPLCGPPLHLAPFSHPEPGRPGVSQAAALRAILRDWSSTSLSTTASGAHSAAPLGPGSQPRLARLVSVLLEAYREHQLARLGAVAATLPRLQFELSTLELGPRVQLELQQQQVCFALRLPSLDLTRLLELAELYGARIPPPPPPQHQQQHQTQGPSDDVLESLEADSLARGRPPSSHPLDEASGSSNRDPAAGHQGGGPGPGPAAADLVLAAAVEAEAGIQLVSASAPLPETHQHHQQQQQSAAAAGKEFTLLATFRLPAAGGADMGDPELSLQLPQVLQELAAAASAHGSRGAAAGAAGAAASSFAGAGGGSGGIRAGCGLPLVPSFLLPLWSPHMCLAEFVPLAVERLQAQLDAHCSVLAARQQLLDRLGHLLGPPLELNLPAGAALFAVAWEGTSLLLSLELGARFPTDKPSLVLQAVRVLPGADSSRTYRDYPWSPRWSPGEMAARIHNWLQVWLYTMRSCQPSCTAECRSPDRENGHMTHESVVSAADQGVIHSRGFGWSRARPGGCGSRVAGASLCRCCF